MVAGRRNTAARAVRRRALKTGLPRAPKFGNLVPRAWRAGSGGAICRNCGKSTAGAEALESGLPNAPELRRGGTSQLLRAEP